MENSQTIRFSSTNANAVCHNMDEMTVGSGALNITSPYNSFSINSSETIIKLDPTTHTSGSSAVATKNITNYPWELVYIPGNLVAVHSSRPYLAYAIIGPINRNGVVRIVDRRTGSRGLIKNIPGLIKDMSFAYLSSRVLLAFIDHFGTLFVYEILEEKENLKTELLVEVKKNDDEEASNYQRVIWCPFIPDESGEEEQEETDDENFSYLLVVTNGPSAEIWHIMSLIEIYGSGSIDRSELKPGPGQQVLEEDTAPISDAAFSPDGTALATASLDGYVKFFQVYMADNQNSPRCLHQWNPHDGKPLSCLFFLDNRKNPSPDVQFWKFAVTGACNNTEIKTWSCESWQCNQSIRFEMSDNSNIDSNNLSLKAAIDPSSKYLILSDIYRRVLHILIINQEPAHPEGVSNGDSLEASSPQIHIAGKGGVARIVSITELPIQYPAIFLTITDAEWKPYKRWKHEQLGQDGYQEDHLEDADEDSDNIDIVVGLVLKCVLINTKSLQDTTIRFQPILPLSANFDRLCNSATKHTLNSTEDSVVIKDGLTDLSINLSSTLSDMDPSSLCGTIGTRKHSEDRDGLEKENLLVSFPSNSGPQTILGTNSPSDNSSVSTASAVMMSMNETKPVPSLTSPSIAAHHGSSSIVNTQDCAVAIQQQPVTMTLLTPESFSSPGRIEEDDTTMKKEVDVTRVTEQRDMFAKNSPSPSEEIKSAALSLLLRVNSGSGLPVSEAASSGPPLNTLTSPSSSDMMSKNILETVVAGSSRTSPDSVLPPPPRTGPSPLPNKEEGPLATSEVSHPPEPRSHPCSEASSNIISNPTMSGGSTTIPHVGSFIGLASSTSSPSLEVQQILHSHNNKNEDDFADEDEERMEGSRSMKQNSPQNKDTSRCQSLQELINISSDSKNDSSQVKTSQSPLIDMFSGFKDIHSSTTSDLTHLLESGLKQTSPLCDTSVSNVSILTGGIPVSSLAYASTDNTPSLPLLKEISLGKNHLTCEELEAEIKSSSPTTKKSKASDLPFTTSTSSTGLSTLAFPMSFGTPSVNHSATKDPPFSKNNVSLEADANRHNKTLAEITSLRQLIYSCDEGHLNRTNELMEHTMNLSNQMEKSLKNLHQVNEAIDELRKAQNKLHDQIPHLVSSSAKTIIENCIRQEIRNSLTPALNKCIEPIRSQLSSEIRSLVSNSEVHLSESLSKAALSKSFIDNLSSSVASALSVSVQTACRDAYNKVVVPGFNAISQQVFVQLNEAFTRGTKEYLQHIENECHSTRNALVDNVSASSRTLETTSSTLSTHVSVLMDTLHKNLAQQTTLSETLGDRLRHLVHDEMTRALQEHHATVEARTSRAQTPAPSVSHTPTNPKLIRQQVQQLITQGQFNLAFKQALSASDLSLVVFICERINPQQLFLQTPCALSQDVLLSLINQLSHDLTTFTDLKTKYLEEAVMNLDTTHPVTREHMRKVLQEFQLSLSSHLELHPNHKKLKMLLLAVNHLVAAS